MTKFLEAWVKSIPRVVVQWEKGATPDKDKYSTTLQGGMPVSQLVGFLTRVQSELMFRRPDECDELALVVFFDPATMKMSWFVHPSVPVDPLIGTLEVLKATLVGNQLADIAKQQARAAQNGLVDQFGNPIARRHRG